MRKFRELLGQGFELDGLLEEISLSGNVQEQLFLFFHFDRKQVLVSVIFTI